VETSCRTRLAAGAPPLLLNVERLIKMINETKRGSLFSIQAAKNKTAMPTCTMTIDDDDDVFYMKNEAKNEASKMTHEVERENNFNMKTTWVIPGVKKL
jgi:hypothetical protein